MKRIMVCDDEPHIVEGLRFLLRAPDRHVEVTTSGKEALQCIQEQVPDLLITDIMMPEMSGLEVVATLRADAATKDLPIIIITAKGQARDAAMAQEVWGATVVAKPFQPRKLREIVSSILEADACPQPSSG
ncbi:MAG: response regulator transcription factor [Phycisphaerae bacterium]